MYKLILASLLLASTPAFGDIKVPYFQKLKAQDVCGGFNKDCQPSGAPSYKAFDGIDYNGKPESFIGRSYRDNIRQTSPCLRTPIPKDALDRHGKANIHGTLVSSGKTGFKVTVDAKVDELVRDLIASLPKDLQVSATAAYKNSVDTASDRTIDLEYERMELTQDFQDNQLSKCLQNEPKNRWVITGISVIKVSGEWGKSRIKDLISHVEAQVGYKKLSVGAKAEWNRKKNLTLKGRFEPISYVFAYGLRQGEKR